MGARSRLAQAYFDLATLLDAGVPILRSLDILIDGRQGSLKRTFRQVRESLSQGANLAESLNRHRQVFPDLDRMLIEAAETSGSLGDSFKMLSQWHEFVQRITRRMQMGLIYPFFIFHMAALLIGLPAFVLGKVSVAAYLAGVLHILAFLYVPMILVVASTRLRDRIPAVRLPLDFLALKIPVLGQAIYHMSICRYAKAFAMLYKAGVPITETVERATRATGNVIVAGQLAGARESVRQGGTAWEGFSSRVPAEYRHLWQIGEETGELDKVATKVAELSGERADLFFTAFANGFPKVVYFAIMIFMAIMVLQMWSQIYGGLGDF
jgi:type II secretory pathway component PulF